MKHRITSLLLCPLLLASALLAGCKKPTAPPGFRQLGEADLQKFPTGEQYYWIDSDAANLEGLSFILATEPEGAGPTLHTHDHTDEYHVVMEHGEAIYVLGDVEKDTLGVYNAKGPFVARIPAGTPHAVANAGKNAINIIGIFPTNEIKPDKKKSTWFNGTIDGVEISFDNIKNARELIDYLVEENDFKVRPASEAPLRQPESK